MSLSCGIAFISPRVKYGFRKARTSATFKQIVYNTFTFGFGAHQQLTWVIFFHLHFFYVAHRTQCFIFPVDPVTPVVELDEIARFTALNSRHATKIRPIFTVVRLLSGNGGVSSSFLSQLSNAIQKISESRCRYLKTTRNSVHCFNIF